MHPIGMRQCASSKTSFLIRLYKSLGQFDVLQGIFSSKIGTQELTMQALEAEMRGDYQEAVRKYTEVSMRFLSLESIH